MLIYYASRRIKHKKLNKNLSIKIPKLKLIESTYSNVNDNDEALSNKTKETRELLSKQTNIKSYCVYLYFIYILNLKT